MSKQHPHKHSKTETTSSERSSVSAEGHRKRHHPQGKRKHESLTKQRKKSTFVEANKNARAQAKTSSYKQNKQTKYLVIGREN